MTQIVHEAISLQPVGIDSARIAFVDCDAGGAGGVFGGGICDGEGLDVRGVHADCVGDAVV